MPGDLKDLKSRIIKLEKSAPHQRNGERICKGMQKAGMQSHVHIIMSRKDNSNSFSLSPGSRHKASEGMLHGKIVKRGFHRDAFFLKAEKTFDRTFGYKRNFVETYQVRKTLIKDPKLYFTYLMGLPASEKAVAFKMLRKAGIPAFNIPANKVQLALRAFQKVKKGLEIATKSAAIEI